RRRPSRISDDALQRPRGVGDPAERRPSGPSTPRPLPPPRGRGPGRVDALGRRPMPRVDPAPQPAGAEGLVADGLRARLRRSHLPPVARTRGLEPPDGPPPP